MWYLFGISPPNAKLQLNKSQFLQREKPGWKLHIKILHLLLHLCCIQLFNFHYKAEKEVCVLAIINTPCSVGLKFFFNAFNRAQ